jgi:hypothetical protein
LTVRKQQIEEDLHRVQQNRQLILHHLLVIAETGTRLLKSAVKHFHLPASLSAFEKRAFLQIQYKDLSLEERRLKIAGLLDRYMQAGVVPNGLALIQEVVRTLIYPVKVSCLFPRP